MRFELDGVLTAAEVARIREVLANTEFVDGRVTAGHTARGVKRNLQADPQDPTVVECGDLVTTALLRHEAFSLRALPCRVLPPIFNRYDAAMEYGRHVDNAIMGGGSCPPARADVSLTIFLSDPDEYDGGSLVIEGESGRAAFRPAAGSAVVYDGTTLHAVEPVTRGRRLAAVTWVQSLVRDGQRREMLLELTELVDWSRGLAPDSPEVMKLIRVRANLLRLWAEL